MRREEDGAQRQWERRKKKAGNGLVEVGGRRERMVMSKPTSNLVMTMPRGWDW